MPQEKPVTYVAFHRQHGVKAWELNCEKLLFEQGAEESLKMAQEKTVKIVALHCQHGVKAWEMLTQKPVYGHLAK